jgi:hypothetical protein
MNDGEAQGLVTEYVAVRAAGNPFASGQVEKVCARGGRITRETVFSDAAPLRAGRLRVAMKRLPVAADGTLGQR